jgi:hypothetical protein
MSNQEKVIRVSSGNNLLIDNETLNLWKSKRVGGKEISAEELKRILGLELARRAITQGIVANYKKLQQLKESDSDLTISPPALFVVRFASPFHDKRVFTPEALERNNTSIHTEVNDLKTKYHAYWRAVSENGFIPHVLRGYGDIHTGGIYLKLRVPHPEIEDEMGYEFPEELQ